MENTFSDFVWTNVTSAQSHPENPPSVHSQAVQILRLTVFIRQTGLSSSGRSENVGTVRCWNPDVVQRFRSVARKLKVPKQRRLWNPVVTKQDWNPVCPSPSLSLLGLTSSVHCSLKRGEERAVSPTPMKTLFPGKNAHPLPPRPHGEAPHGRIHELIFRCQQHSDGRLGLFCLVIQNKTPKESLHLLHFLSICLPAYLSP